MTYTGRSLDDDVEEDERTTTNDHRKDAARASCHATDQHAIAMPLDRTANVSSWLA